MAGKGKAGKFLEGQARGALGALTDAYKKTFDPETYYHATGVPDIKKFDPFAESPHGAFDEAGATFFTPDKKLAEHYLYGSKGAEYLHGPVDKSSTEAKEIADEYGRVPTVYEVKIKTDKLFDPNDESHIQKVYEENKTNFDNIDNFKNYVDEAMEGASYADPDHDFYEMLKGIGFRGFRNKPNEVGLFYPDKGDVRSVFAKFDPKKSKSGNILASVPAAALVTGGALSGLVDE